MESVAISTRIVASNPAVSIVDVVGVLDVNTVGDLETAFEGLRSRKQYKIILNFEKLTYVSSAGIWLLLDQIGEARKEGGDIMVAGLCQEVHKLFDLLELPTLFYIFKTDRDAVAAFGSNNFQTNQRA